MFSMPSYYKSHQTVSNFKYRVSNNQTEALYQTHSVFQLYRLFMFQWQATARSCDYTTEIKQALSIIY